MLKLEYNKENIIKGALVYSLFDAIAAIILNEFSILRFVGIMIVGGTVYAMEIPNYFAWIEKKSEKFPVSKRPYVKTLYALAYFNPLWIARHLAIIEWLNHGEITLQIFDVAYKSFLFNIPVSFLANFMIQNLIHLRYRYLASAIFSGLMAVYYAFSKVMFS